MSIVILRSRRRYGRICLGIGTSRWSPPRYRSAVSSFITVQRLYRVIAYFDCSARCRGFRLYQLRIAVNTFCLSLNGSSTTVVATKELTVPFDETTAVDALLATPLLCTTSEPVLGMPFNCVGNANSTDFNRNRLLYFDFPTF